MKSKVSAYQQCLDQPDPPATISKLPAYQQWLDQPDPSATISKLPAYQQWLINQTLLQQ